MHIKFKNGIEAWGCVYFQIGITNGILVYHEADENNHIYERTIFFKPEDIEFMEVL